MAGVKKQHRLKKKGKTSGRDAVSAAELCPDVDVLFTKQTIDGIQTKFTDSLRRWAEKKLDVRLPESYVALLKKRNGGALRLTAIKMRRPKDWPWDHGYVYTFNEIVGVDRKNQRSITSFAEEAWSLPEGLIPFACDNHFWLCLDYRRCGPDGEPTITDHDDESAGEFRVARSFEELLSRLIFDCGEYVFAIDDPDVLDGSLDQQLVELGCRRRFPRDTKKADHTGPANWWKWPQYSRSHGEKAELQLRRNGGIAAWTMARPGEHQLLCLDVCQSAQKSEEAPVFFVEYPCT